MFEKQLFQEHEKHMLKLRTSTSVNIKVENHASMNVDSSTLDASLLLFGYLFIMKLFRLCRIKCNPSPIQ